MGAVAYLRDRLSNIMTGLGTTADKRTAAFYAFIPLTPQEAEASYRTSWLARKIVDIPPFDMTREGRDWQTKSARIEDIEAEEKRLQLWPKLQRALILSRLYGGGALILGGPGKASEELKPEQVGKAGLKYIHVMSRHQLSEGEMRQDPEDPWFGHPVAYTINGSNGQNVVLHPSRVVAFIGQKSPEGGFYSSTSWFWGDPIMQSIGEAVKNADLAQSGFASLIDEAKLDIIKMPDLMSVWSTDEHQDALLNRLALANVGKSTHRALILDGNEDWQQRQVTWDGIPEAGFFFLQVCCGAADIPVTRLLGTSPKGLQSTGDGEERDYHAMVKARQGELLAPALDRIDPLLLRSSLGNVPDDVYYEFAPLGGTNEKDEAEIESKYASAFKTRLDTGAIPDDALAKAEVNRMIESGRYPGLEAAIEESEKELGVEEPDEGDLPEIEMQPPAPRQPQPRKPRAPKPRA